jgi:hypothetical protein
MMGLAAVPEPQGSLYEVQIDNPEIEAALEKRQKAKEARAALDAKFKEADGAAK